mgnify:CR=1 FL=1
MEVIEVQRKAIDFAEYVKRSAVFEDAPNMITGDTLFTENGKPIILYKKIDFADTKALRQAVQRVKYAETTRTAGLKTQSAIFGYNPRNVIRKDFCSATAMSFNQPAEHQVITDFAQELTRLYEQTFPDTFNRHKGAVSEKILPEWKMKGELFTSGICNKNNPLKYHFDSGNIKDVLSNMVVFKYKSEGGHLAIPELNVTLECADNTVVLFDGQSLLHGVTPIDNRYADSYRYSVVYYTLQQMWNCLPLTGEIARIRKLHKQREQNRSNERKQAKTAQQEATKEHTE